MKGYRTIAFNLIMAAVAITGANVDPSQVEGFVTAFFGVWTGGNLILRAITNSPIFRKEPK